MNPTHSLGFIQFHKPFKGNSKKAGVNLFQKRLAPLEGSATKKSRIWTLLPTKKNLSHFFQRGEINALKRKLNGDPAKPNNLLTPKECAKALKLVEKWLEYKKGKAPEILEDFMIHLAENNYIVDLEELRKNKPKYFDNLKIYTKKLSEYNGKDKEFKKNFSIQLDPFGPKGFIDRYIAPQLLLPARGPPLSFSKEEFEVIVSGNLNSFYSHQKESENGVSREDFLNQMAEQLNSPSQLKKYIQVSEFHNHVPFLLDGQVACWYEISHSSTGVPEQILLKKNLEAMHSAALFFKKQGGMLAFQEKLKNGEISSKTLQEFEQIAATIYWDYDQVDETTLSDQAKAFLEIVKSGKNLKFGNKVQEIKPTKKFSNFLKKHGGVEKFNKKLKNGNLSITTLYELAQNTSETHDSIFNINEQTVDEKTKPFLKVLKNSKKFETLLDFEEVVKKIASLEGRTEEIENLEKKLQEKKFEELDPKELRLVLDLIFLMRSLPGAMLEIEDINKHIPILQKLEDMGLLLFDASEHIFEKRKNPPEHFPKKLIKFFEILDKIERAYEAKEQKHSISKEKKLSLKEFYLHKEYEVLFDGVDEFEIIRHNFNQLVARNEKEPFISVCFFSTRANIEKETSHEMPLIKKAQKLLQIAISKKIFKYHHTNFMEYDGEEFKKHSLWQEGIYHNKFQPHWSPKAKECQIVADALIPENLPEMYHERFKEIFFNYLRFKIQEENLKVKFPSNAYKRFFGIGIPSEKKTPSQIKVEERKEIFCSQFVCEAIIEAHVKACNSMSSLGIAPPASLSYYGLKDSENLPCLTPSKFFDAFTKRGILVEKENPLFR